MNGAEDVDMEDEANEPVKANGDADEEMTVVVPPPKGSKLSGQHEKDPQGDTTMNGSEQPETGPEETERIDPKIKAVSGMLHSSGCGDRNS